MTTEPRASLVEVDEAERWARIIDPTLWEGPLSTLDSSRKSRPHSLAAGQRVADEIARLEALRTQGDGEWFLVPREPTTDMIRAAAIVDGQDEQHPYVALWSAMLSAAPTQASSREEGK
ncbi:hypothetical protein GCM10011380_00910 [Sphingomonas metalli]|uniref:Uncharacterized protein n=1 Tax=Sphingomonas metalli TaxID=1779358 RepID=A0A916ST21_9SPHN|nr:hypothetical protein [Sphingomonas metalli]GGB15293.1 hypothetical protein GCM10011380_00910 [Sphingomonas metalli]